MRTLSILASLAFFTLFWLLVANEGSPAQVLLGIVLGAAMLWVRARFGAASLPLHRPGVALQLAALFLVDIVVANFAVARAVLAPSLPIRPRFLEVPLDLREPNAAALLAGMVTLTPGTVSVDLDLDARVLTVHALLAEDEAAAVNGIKQRYEARIREIFQC